MVIDSKKNFQNWKLDQPIKDGLYYFNGFYDNETLTADVYAYNKSSNYHKKLVMNIQKTDDDQKTIGYARMEYAVQVLFYVIKSKDKIIRWDKRPEWKEEDPIRLH